MSDPAADAGKPDRRLPLSRRLVRSEDFRSIFDSGRNVVGSTMVMWVCRTDGQESRVGVVASKRTFRRAVDRNRAKRRLREAFRLHRDQLIPGTDLVIVARWRLLEADSRRIENEFVRLCSKAKVLEQAA